MIASSPPSSRHLPPQCPQKGTGIVAIISASDEIPSTATGREEETTRNSVA